MITQFGTQSLDTDDNGSRDDGRHAACRGSGRGGPGRVGGEAVTVEVGGDFADPHGQGWVVGDVIEIGEASHDGADGLLGRRGLVAFDEQGKPSSTHRCACSSHGFRSVHDDVEFGGCQIANAGHRDAFDLRGFDDPLIGYVCRASRSTGVARKKSQIMAHAMALTE
ncbi:MAG: hypothetical protein ACRD0K_00880 [Egibacteraceae bacterium]